MTNETSSRNSTASITPGIALWNQRFALRENRARLISLLEAVHRPQEMSPLQMMGLTALALDFKPDMILELGRLYGNSTCVFTEAANMLGANNCRVTSLCLTPNWHRVTVNRLRTVVDNGWFQNVDALREDILTFDYQSLFRNHQRVMVFWDAHGYEVANCVLGRILPLLSDREHLVAVHDMSDARYMDSNLASYRGQSLWTRNDWSGRHLRLGWIQSNVEQAVAIVDFASRNQVQLNSATHSMRTDLSQPQLAEVDDLLGIGASRSEAGWLSFSLNGTRPPWTFPKFAEPTAGNQLRTKALMAGLYWADRLHVEGPVRTVARALRRARG